jgi:ankyrin repeat protein
MNKILILMVLLLALYFLFDSREYFQSSSSGAPTTVGTTNVGTTTSVGVTDIDNDIIDLISKLDDWNTLNDEETFDITLSILILMTMIFTVNVSAPILVIIISQNLFENTNNDNENTNNDNENTNNDNEDFIILVNDIKSNLKDKSIRDKLKLQLNNILQDIEDGEDIFNIELINEFNEFKNTDLKTLDIDTQKTIVELSKVTKQVKKEKTDKKENEQLNKIISKNSCIDKEKNCSIGYVPYSELELYGINPATKQKFTGSERESLKKRFDDKCKSSNGKDQICCDQYDNKLENVRKYIPQEDLDQFDKVSVKKCNNKISEIKVCSKDTEDCGEGNWRKPSVYEICKLRNLDEGDYKGETKIDIDKLTPDCSINQCNSNEIYLRIDQKYNNDAKITENYYLIDAIKKDHVEYLSEYFNTKYNTSVNDKLLFGYSGNTVFHHAIYYNSFKCIEYLLTTNFDYSSVNRDDNSVLHIACLKGNYEAVFKLLKHGVSVECKNIHGDTALHSAVRSGSYNCVKMLLENNAGACVIEKNKYGETPLHTAVIPVTADTELDNGDNEDNIELNDRMNFNIVKLLVDYGSDIHNKNNKGELIIQTLLKKNKSIVREEIRTYLQRQYYQKYTTTEYEKLLEEYEEIRPFELDTSIDENLKGGYDEYDKNNIEYKNLVTYTDDSELDYNLYTKKRTRALKDKIPVIEGFENSNNLNSIGNCKISNIVAIVLIIIVIIFILFNKY